MEDSFAMSSLPVKTHDDAFRASHVNMISNTMGLVIEGDMTRGIIFLLRDVQSEHSMCHERLISRIVIEICCRIQEFYYIADSKPPLRICDKFAHYVRIGSILPPLDFENFTAAVFRQDGKLFGDEPLNSLRFNIRNESGNA